MGRECPQRAAAGVEEEFHIVDARTRQLTGQADLRIIETIL